MARRRLPPPLAGYLGVVTALGLPLAVWLLLGSLHTPLTKTPAQVGALVAALVVSELMPIRITRRGRPSDEITVSATFSLALVLVAPLGLAVLAQSLPVLYDDVRRRKPWYRPLFNVGQYALTIVAARLVFVALTGAPFFGGGELPPHHLPAALAAGAVFHLVNTVLVGSAYALFLREPVRAHLLPDLRFALLSSSILLGLTPLAIAAVDYTPVVLPVLLLPIAAVHSSAKLAAMREHEALHDVLTGLPNRALLHLHFARMLDEGERAHDGLAVLLIDLDHFKEINDTLGHHAGDLLLCEVAGRLRSTLRAGDTVARLGGDEFAILMRLTGGTRRDEAETVAARVITCLQEPFTVADVRLTVQASVGIALRPVHGQTIEELMSRADVALYAAKEERGRWCVYDPEQDEHTPERLALLGELRDGIGRGELELRYQPKCDAGSGGVVGVEALVRWRHPRCGLLAPDAFIPLAENTGLIGALTLEVLDQALAQVRRWTAAGRPLGVAVNLSMRQLTDLQLPARVAEMLDRHDVPATSLTLEVTESSIMKDPSRSVLVLAGLRALGVHIAVDDYGTGYSSLAYLRQLAVDELKIDRSFIGNLDGSDNDEVIVRSTIELGHNLGLVVVAEGVEDADTWTRLRQLGCDLVQGYHFSRPLTAEEFEQWLAARAGERPAPRLPVLQPDGARAQALA